MKKKQPDSETPRGRIFLQNRRQKDGSMRQDKLYTMEGTPYSGGKRFKESTKTSDRDVAMTALSQRMGPKKADAPSGTATFAEVMAVLQEDYKLSDKDGSLYKLEHGTLGNLNPFFGKMPSREIVDRTLTRYQLHRKDEGAANSTMNNELAALHRAFVLAKREGIVTHVPKFTRRPCNNARQGFFEWAQVGQLQKHLPETLTQLIEVYFFTGWRKHEVRLRRWPDIDFDNNTMTLWRGQGKDRKIGRQFPLVPGLRRALMAQRAFVDKIEAQTGKKVPWVFPKEDGTEYKSFRGRWEKAVALSGVDRFIHDFRRTAVRNCEKARMPRKVAMQAIGIKTESIYNRYAIVDESMTTMAAGMLADYFAQKGYADGTTVQ